MPEDSERNFFTFLLESFKLSLKGSINLKGKERETQQFVGNYLRERKNWEIKNWEISTNWSHQTPLTCLANYKGCV